MLGAPRDPTERRSLGTPAGGSAGRGCSLLSATSKLQFRGSGHAGTRASCAPAASLDLLCLVNYLQRLTLLTSAGDMCGSVSEMLRAFSQR